MQKSRYSVCSFFMSSQFQVHIMKLTTLIFDHSTSNICNNFLICMNLYQHSKKSVNFICSFFRYNEFQNPEIRFFTPTFDLAQSRNFQSTFNFCEAVSSICSGEITDLNILQSDGLRAFCTYISGGTRCFPIQDLYGSTTNNT